jgi:hypothetical protein
MLLLLPRHLGCFEMQCCFGNWGVRIENYNYLVFKVLIICPSETKITIIEEVLNLDWEIDNL